MTTDNIETSPTNFDTNLTCSQSLSHISEALKTTIEKIEIMNSGGRLGGIETGFKALDSAINGLCPGELTIVAARPAVGKTTFSMNIAEHVALNLKKPVAVFSIAMSKERMAMRMLSSVSRINLRNIRTGQLIDDDWSELTKAFNKLNSASIFIDDTPILGSNELCSKARKLHQDHGEIGLIIIDCIQMMSANSLGYSGNRADVIAETMYSLRALAKELNVPALRVSMT